MTLLTTCSSCLKIKDESGNWCSAEDFALLLAQGAMRTHTICLSCLEQNYPEFYRLYLLHTEKNQQDAKVKS